MSAPRTKRQFAGAAADPSQRQITSFFGPSSSTSTSSSASASAPDSEVSTPNLPAAVQANLLSVGMRVRKSVPEGYKTGSTHSGFKLWNDGYADTPYESSANNVSNLRINTASAPSQRELLPFCGINRVGGLAAQPSYEAPAPYSSLNPYMDREYDGVPTEDDVPGLIGSSQESNATTTSAYSSFSAESATTNRKRIFDDADRSDEPVRVWRDRSAWMDGEVSPRSVAPSAWGNARVLAVPRRSSARRKGGVASEARTPAWAALEQENVAIADFEEADFLDYRAMDLSDD